MFKILYNIKKLYILTQFDLGFLVDLVAQSFRRQKNIIIKGKINIADSLKNLTSSLKIFFSCKNYYW